jgi:hypothetical protein
MKSLKIVGTICLAATVATGCIKTPGASKNNPQSSSFTSVKMRVPTMIGNKDVSGKITGYSLQVKKTAGSCEFSDIERTEAVGTDDVKIDAKLKQECDYSILLSFGKISTDLKKLDRVYLTSDSYEGKPAKPAVVKKEDLKGKTEITIRACVSVTSEGAQDLGVNAAECPSITDNSINNPQPSNTVMPISTDLKLSTSMTGTAEGNQVLFSGEVTSSSTATKYCGVAVEAFYEEPSPKLVVLTQNFVEIKAGAKLAINETVNFETGTLSGPLSFTELRVIEQCMDTKPDATVKVADSFTKCYASKTCPQVKP